MLLLVAVFGAVTVATGGLRLWLLRGSFVDVPNERSSHSVPTPRGGGIAVVVAGLAAMWLTNGLPTVILVGAMLLAAVSWIDDVRSLPVLPRFAAQIIAVAAAVVFVLPPDEVLPFPLPTTAAALLIGVAWVWFVNLYNFMDGIDGISGVETISICVGVALIGSQVPAAEHLVMPALTIAAGAAGFLWWNWHPAKIFLGDVGSVPLGFMTGYLLLDLAVSGAPEAALLLPGYYLADATITLLRRAWRREKIWRAHREHFYQRAYQRGLPHSAISLRIAAINIILIGSAQTAIVGRPLLGLTVGAVVIVVFLLHLQGRRDEGSMEDAG